MGYKIIVKKMYTDKHNIRQYEVDHEVDYETWDIALRHYDDWNFKVENDGTPDVVVYNSYLLRTNDAGEVDAHLEKDYRTGEWVAYETYWKLIKYERRYNEFGFVADQWSVWSDWYHTLKELYDDWDSADYEIEEGAIEHRRIVDDELLERRPIGEADER